jgi:hypothetical protein
MRRHLTLLRTAVAALHRRERGQMVVMGVFAVTLGLVAIGLAVDFGYWWRDRRDAQNDVDAIALAAAQALPDTLESELEGEEWAVANNVNPSEDLDAPPCGAGWVAGSFCFEDLNGDGEADLVRARVLRDSQVFVAQVFGAGAPNVGANAAAAKIRASGACVMPWAIDAVTEDPDAFDSHYGVLGDPPDDETLFIFQLGSGGDFAGEDGSPGNFGALGVYGGGAVDYKDAIINECGSHDEDACDSGDSGVEPGETLDCESKTGNLGQNTNSALNERDERFFGFGPNTACDAQTYDDATGLASGDIDTGYDCAGARLVPVAVIKDFPPSGSSAPTEIYAIDNFYIAGWDRSGPWGTGDSDGDPDSGMVWGYLIQSELGATPAWEFSFDASSAGNNPFAPVITALVE